MRDLDADHTVPELEKVLGRGILSVALHADGRHNQLLYVDGGQSLLQG